MKPTIVSCFLSLGVISLAPFSFAQSVTVPSETQPVVTSVPNTSGLTPIPATIVAPELEEPGVFYLHRVMALPVHGKVEALTTMYGHRDYISAVATLIPGQIIEVVGIAPEGFFVRPVVPNSNVMGWIHLEQLPSNVDQKTLAQAQQFYQRQQEIQVAVANKTVIQGMTPEDVEKSIGKAERVLKQTLPQGVFETWTYTTYKQVPQNAYAVDSQGQPVSQTYYERVPIGSLTVNFTNGAVTSIQEQRSDPDSPGVYAQDPNNAPAQQQAVTSGADTAPPVVVQQQPGYTDNGASYTVPAQTYYPVWGGYGYQNNGGYNRPGYNQNNYSNNRPAYNQNNNSGYNSGYHSTSQTQTYTGNTTQNPYKGGTYYNYSYNNPSNKH